MKPQIGWISGPDATTRRVISIRARPTLALRYEDHFGRPAALILQHKGSVCLRIVLYMATCACSDPVVPTSTNLRDRRNAQCNQSIGYPPSRLPTSHAVCTSSTATPPTFLLHFLLLQTRQGSVEKTKTPGPLIFGTMLYRRENAHFTI